ncbi:MAG TPA: hypothetical protein VEV43_02435 [Actinomycetota bacterium]|nr:hypothetical protein [Actinomycetota bacterium]
MQYRTALVGNVSNRWTKRGAEQEMNQLTATINSFGQGSRLHSVQPIPVFNIAGNQTGITLLAVYEDD